MTLLSSGLTLGCALEHLSFKETSPTQQLLCGAGRGRRILGSKIFLSFFRDKVSCPLNLVCPKTCSLAETISNF